MEALKSITESKRAVIAVLLILGTVVLTAMGKMSVEQFLEYSATLFMTYAGAETISHAVRTIKQGKAPKAKS